MDDRLWLWLHVVSNALFAGGIVSALLVQSLLHRAVDDVERKHLARTAAMLGRTFVAHASTLGFLSGGLVMWTRYNLYGAGKLMACAPVYVHLMLGFGLVAVGLVHPWAARARKIAAALEKNAPYAEVRPHVLRGWVLGVVAAVFAIAAFTVAITKVPNPPRNSCVAAAQ